MLEQATRTDTLAWCRPPGLQSPPPMSGAQLPGTPLQLLMMWTLPSAPPRGGRGGFNEPVEENKACSSMILTPLELFIGLLSPGQTWSIRLQHPLFILCTSQKQTTGALLPGCRLYLLMSCRGQHLQRQPPGQAVFTALLPGSCLRVGLRAVWHPQLSSHWTEWLKYTKFQANSSVKICDTCRGLICLGRSVTVISNAGGGTWQVTQQNSSAQADLRHEMRKKDPKITTWLFNKACQYKITIPPNAHISKCTRYWNQNIKQKSSKTMQLYVKDKYITSGPKI